VKRFTILHTIETGGPGGAETVLLETASRLDPGRFRSLVVLAEDGWLRQQLLARGVHTVLVQWKAWYDFRLPRSMADLVRREKVDVIHSHLPGQNFYSCVVGRWTGCRTIVTYHGAVELERARRARDSFKLWFVRRSADAVVVVCDHVKRKLQQCHFPSEKIERIYNGIDTTRFTGSANGRLRAELGYGKQTQLVGMVANIRQTKGYEYFIRAARKVVDAHPDAVFLAIGDDQEQMGAGMLPLIDSLGLGSHFRFLGFRSDVPAVLSELDVFVLSSTSEGFPLVVLEAMAAGKPVVVTRCGGPEEVVEDGREGFLVPPTDVEALASKIGVILRDPWLGAMLGVNGRIKVSAHFSLEKMVKDHEALYARCLAAS
jgi:glycosyltransferase involved in cell wall biosynthesis